MNEAVRLYKVSRFIGLVCFTIGLGSTGQSARAQMMPPPPPPLPGVTKTVTYAHLLLADAEWQVNGQNATQNSLLVGGDLSVSPPKSASYTVGGWYNRINSSIGIYGAHGDVYFGGVGAGLASYWASNSTTDYSIYLLLRPTKEHYYTSSIGLGPYWADFTNSLGSNTRKLGFNAYINGGIPLGSKRVSLDGSVWYITAGGISALRSTVGIGINFG